MAGIVKLDTDGEVEAPLSAKELAYSTIAGELYVGSGSGTATAGAPVTLVPGTEDAGEYRVTRNKELADLTTAAAIKEQTVNTETKYTDSSTATNYKMYIEDGDITLEEIV
jgi:hypothetical protein